MSARALIVAMLASAQTVAAPCKQASPLNTKDPAPCDGQLLPELWARDGLKCRKVDIPSLEARCQFNEEKARANLASARKQERACVIALKAAENDTESPSPAWYQRPVVQMLFGAALFAGGVLLGSQF